MEEIRINAGLDDNGRQKYVSIPVYDEMPQGWKEIKGAMTAPKGYVWIHNGKSLFGGEYRDGFLRKEGKA